MSKVENPTDKLRKMKVGGRAMKVPIAQAKSIRNIIALNLLEERQAGARWQTEMKLAEGYMLVRRLS